MKFAIALTAALLCAACQTAPDAKPDQTTASKNTGRVCPTGSNICGRGASPGETLTREDMHNRDNLPAQRPAQ